MNKKGKPFLRDLQNKNTPATKSHAKRARSYATRGPWIKKNAAYEVKKNFMVYFGDYYLKIKKKHVHDIIVLNSDFCD